LPLVLIDPKATILSLPGLRRDRLPVGIEGEKTWVGGLVSVPPVERREAFPYARIEGRRKGKREEVKDEGKGVGIVGEGDSGDV